MSASFLARRPARRTGRSRWFRGELPLPECETFSERDLTTDERAEFTRWLVGHPVRQSELLLLCARGNRSLVAAHICVT